MADKRVEITKRALLQKVYEIAKQKLDAQVMPYSKGEVAEWDRWVQAAEAGDLTVFEPLVAGTNQTAQDFAATVLAKRDALRAYRDAVVNARNRHKESIAALATLEECRGYDLNDFWP